MSVKRMLMILCLALGAAAVSAVTATPETTTAQDQYPYVDVAVSLSNCGGSIIERVKVCLTIANLGTFPAYDVEVTVEQNAETTTGSTYQIAAAALPSGVSFSEPLAIPGIPALTQSGVLTVAELPAMQSYTVSLDTTTTLLWKNSAKITRMGSYESPLHRGNNEDEIWLLTFNGNSYTNDAAYHTTATMDPVKDGASSVRIVVQTGHKFTSHRTGSRARFQDGCVDVALPAGIAPKPMASATVSLYRLGITTLLPFDRGITYQSGESCGDSSSDDVSGSFEIGDSFTYTIRYIKFEISLPVTVTDEAVAEGRCVRVEIFAEPEPGPGEHDDDPRDNVSEACPPRPELFSEGEVDIFTIYDCFARKTAPCDGTDGVRVRAVNRNADPDVIMAPGTTFVQVRDPVARVYDSYVRNNVQQSVTDATTVSWQTATDAHNNFTGTRAGVKIFFSRDPFNDQLDNWVRVAGEHITVKSLEEGNPPGDMHIRGGSGSAFTKMNSGNSWTATYRGINRKTNQISPSSWFAEFEELGTYVLKYTTVANRDDTNGDCQTKYLPTGVTAAYCDTETYIFHVGPIAELEVRDGGASHDAAPHQTAFTVVAVNNGSDVAVDAEVEIDLSSLPAGVTVADHVASDGTYANGTWSLGDLKTPGRRRGAGLPEHPTLTLILSGAGATTVTATATLSIANNYSVCIDSDGDDVTLTSPSETACTTEDSTNSWHSGTVYDYQAGNNTVELTARPGSSAPREGQPTGLETMGDPPSLVVLKWPTVPTVNGVPVKHYHVQKWAPDDTDPLDGEWEDQTPDKVLITMWVDESPGEDPQYRVRAVNGPGVPGPWSERVYGKQEQVKDAGVEVDLDPDTAGDQHELTVEEGDEFEYTVKLTAQPSYLVFIRVDAGAGLTADLPRPPSYELPSGVNADDLIIFHLSDWDTAQRVKVTVDESLEIDAARDVTIRHVLTPVGGFNRLAGYDGVTVPELTLTVNDTTYQRAGFHSLGEKTLLVETDGTETYTIRPTVRPTKDVTITLASSNTDVATIDTDPDTAGDQNTITFRPRDFRAELVTLADGTELYAAPVSGNVPGEITVTGVGAGDASITITGVNDLDFNRNLTDAAQAVKVDAPKPTVSPPEFPTAPIMGQEATVDMIPAFSYTAPEATDPNGDNITYTASLTDGSPLPAWLTFTPSTRKFTGTPRVCDAPASYSITVTATDDGPIPQSASKSFTLTVAGTGALPWHQTVSKEDYARYAEENNAEPPFDELYNRPPLFLEGESATRSVAGSSTPPTDVGAPFVACDPDGDALLYNYLDGANFSLNAATGQLTTKSGVTYDKAAYDFNVIVEEQREAGYLSGIAVTVTIE